MTLDEFVGQGWSDHATDAAGVMARFPEGLGLVKEAAHHPALAALVTHVAGEHLGRWSDGIALLERLEQRAGFDAKTPEGKAVLRSKAVLARCAGDAGSEARWEAASRLPEFPEASNRVRVLAIAAAAKLGQGRVDEARADLEEALRLAGYGPTAKDPAARALAITCNNLASELEGKAGRGPGETDLMLHSADAALRYWRIAGGWREEERAEYRIAKSQLAAGRGASALAHAERCLAVVRSNGSDPGELFFGHEAVALALKALGDVTGARAARDAAAATLPSIADEGFRSYCAEALANLG